MTPHEPVCSLEVRGDLDRRAAEALLLEIRALARRHGVSVKSARVEIVPDAEADPSS